MNMTKRLKRIISILCMVTMLFSNISPAAISGVSGNFAVAETIPEDVLNRVDATMGVGQKQEGTILAGETYNIRLSAGAGKVLSLEAKGMPLWVDMYNEGDNSVSRYTMKNGLLQVKWLSKAGSYLLVFNGKDGASGSFTVSVTEDNPAARGNLPPRRRKRLPLPPTPEPKRQRDLR